MAELQPHHARDVARTAMGYSQAFDGKGIDWQNGQPWPHRLELAQALDWITELGAMVLNLADRVDAAEAVAAMADTLPPTIKPVAVVVPDGSSALTLRFLPAGIALQAGDHLYAAQAVAQAVAEAVAKERKMPDGLETLCQGLPARAAMMVRRSWSDGN